VIAPLRQRSRSPQPAETPSHNPRSEGIPAATVVAAATFVGCAPDGEDVSHATPPSQDAVCGAQLSANPNPPRHWLLQGIRQRRTVPVAEAGRGFARLRGVTSRGLWWQHLQCRPCPSRPLLQAIRRCSDVRSRGAYERLRCRDDRSQVVRTRYVTRAFLPLAGEHNPEPCINGDAIRIPSTPNRGDERFEASRAGPRCCLLKHRQRYVSSVRCELLGAGQATTW
jgi:hypothetical protein